MAENLKTTRYADGSAIPLVTHNGPYLPGKAYCWYNNDTVNRDTYGGLYNWAAAMNGASSSSANPSGVQGVCPDGWHLPSDAEWTELTDYLGGAGVAGGKMKEAGTAHWFSPNTGATNSSGFNALPGGGTFDEVGRVAFFWTATEDVVSGPWSRGLFNNSADVSQYNFSEWQMAGFSVRCVKD
jgi:uncharacterized protein (TIGR02145 family)